MRKCHNCKEYIPPETDHYLVEGDEFCTDCIEAQPFIVYEYRLNGEYIGDSEGDGDIEFVESWKMITRKRRSRRCLGIKIKLLKKLN